MLIQGVSVKRFACNEITVNSLLFLVYGCICFIGGELDCFVVVLRIPVPSSSPGLIISAHPTSRSAGEVHATDHANVLDRGVVVAVAPGHPDNPGDNYQGHQSPITLKLANLLLLEGIVTLGQS